MVLVGITPGRATHSMPPFHLASTRSLVPACRAPQQLLPANPRRAGLLSSTSGDSHEAGVGFLHDPYADCAAMRRCSIPRLIHGATWQENTSSLSVMEKAQSRPHHADASGQERKPVPSPTSTWGQKLGAEHAGTTEC